MTRWQTLPSAHAHTLLYPSSTSALCRGGANNWYFFYIAFSNKSFVVIAELQCWVMLIACRFPLVARMALENYCSSFRRISCVFWSRHEYVTDYLLKMISSFKETHGKHKSIGFALWNQMKMCVIHFIPVKSTIIYPTNDFHDRVPMLI